MNALAGLLLCAALCCGCADRKWIETPDGAELKCKYNWRIDAWVTKQDGSTWDAGTLGASSPGWRNERAAKEEAENLVDSGFSPYPCDADRY